MLSGSILVPSYYACTMYRVTQCKSIVGGDPCLQGGATIGQMLRSRGRLEFRYVGQKCLPFFTTLQAAPTDSSLRLLPGIFRTRYQAR